MQAIGKGVNEAGLKASEQIQDNINKSSLESGSLGAVLIYSPKVHTSMKGVNNAGPKALTVVQSPGKSLQ